MVAAAVLSRGWGWSFTIPGVSITILGLAILLLLPVAPRDVGIKSDVSTSPSSFDPTGPECPRVAPARPSGGGEGGEDCQGATGPQAQAVARAAAGAAVRGPAARTGSGCSGGDRSSGGPRGSGLGGDFHGPGGDSGHGSRTRPRPVRWELAAWPPLSSRSLKRPPMASQAPAPTTMARSASSAPGGSPEWPPTPCASSSQS